MNEMFHKQEDATDEAEVAFEVQKEDPYNLERDDDAGGHNTCDEDVNDRHVLRDQTFLSQNAA